jgi:hypothetical protein
MSAGRRVLLPLAFLGAAALLTSGPARAQQFRPEPHEIWNNTLTPDQIKAAIEKLGLGGDGENDPLRKLLRDQLSKQFPNKSGKELDDFIRRATSDPRIMEQARQFAKKKQTDPGRAPKLSAEDRERLAKLFSGAGDPGRPPVKTRPLPDEPLPKDGRPVPPKKDPDPADPKVGPPPVVDPADPMNPPPPGGENPPTPPAPKLEDSLFRPAEESNDPRTKSLQAFAAIWERNVGPLDETPEVKRALFDLVSDANGLDLDIRDDKGNSVWDLLKNGDGSGLDFGNFADGGGSLKLPQMDFPSLKLGKWFGGSPSGGGSSSGSSWWGNSSPRPRPGSTGGGGSGGLGNFGFGGSWFPVVVLGVVVLGILLWVLLKNLRDGAPQPAFVADGLGPWPVDPRQINTREDVVKAFEYLSVLICGPSAKTWTHNTIADALADLAVTHGEAAVMLARLYELARYAPLDEPLTRDELVEARRLVCDLAGVSY